jgi:phosphatidylglycerol:prolipoprotein diacylglycerol transferase
MRPVLFHWRTLTVWSYPAMLYLGLLFGVAAGSFAAQSSGMNTFRVYLATMILIVPALIGARLLYVASEWKSYRREPRRISDRREGGFMMYGSVPVMLLCSMPLLKILHLNFGAFWDVSTFTILVGMMFTRVGCMLNGCCAGRPSKGRFSLYLPNDAGIWQKRIPNQVLEIFCAAALLMLDIGMWRRTPFPGALFLVALLGYCGARLVLEWGRERRNHSRQFGVAYAMSIVFVLTSMCALALNWRR